MEEVRECAVLALFNLRGGSPGVVLDPAAARVGPVADPGRPRPPSDPPTVGLYQLDEGSSAIESAGWLRYLLDNVWRLPYRELDAAAIAAGGLKGTEVLLVPNGSETDAADALGPVGQQALADWVAGGGRYVGWQGGTRLAAALGITTATLASRPPTSPAACCASVSTAGARSPRTSAPPPGRSTPTTWSCGPATRRRWRSPTARGQPRLLRLRVRRRG